MLEHLINFEPMVEDTLGEFTPIPRADTPSIVSAKSNTLDWLKELGAVDERETVDALQQEAARESFTNIVSAAKTEITHTALANVTTPAAVQQLVGMLTAYDWEFVAQAKELRGYCVAQLVEETKNPNPSIRLKALGLLGKVTEVGLFTEKIEIKKVEMSDEEIEQRIKDKLNRFMQVVDVVDVSDAVDAK